MTEQQPRKAKVVLLAEDDKEMRSLLVLGLNALGCVVVESADGVDLLERLGPLFDGPVPGRAPYDLVISDIRMPGLTAFEVLEELRRLAWCPPIILITAFADDETRQRAARMGVVALFDKPFAMEDLVSAAGRVLAS